MEEEVFDIGQALNDFWTQYGAMIISFLSSGAFGTIVVAIVRGIIKRFGRTVEDNARTAMLTPDQLKEIATKVAATLSGSVIDIDLSNVLNKATKDELNGVVVSQEELKRQISTLNDVTALMAKGLSRSKLWKDDEQERLAEASESLDPLHSSAKKEKIQISVANGEQEESETVGGLVKFGG